MGNQSFPFNLNYVQSLASTLEPVTVFPEDGRYVLGLGLTNNCNFDCPICYYHRKNEKMRMIEMSTSLLQSLLNSLPRLAAILIGLEGEPLLHKNFLRMLEIMSCHTNKLILFTNGSLLSPSICQSMKSLPIHKIFLSIDAATQHDYSRFRSGGCLSLFRENVAHAVSVFGQDKAQLHATVFAENLVSLTKLPALAHSLDIVDISIQQMRPHPGTLHRKVTPASQTDIERWVYIFVREANKYNIRVIPDRCFGGPNLYDKLKQMTTCCDCNSDYTCQDSSCIHVEHAAGVLSDGSLFPCAGDFEPVMLYEYSFDSIFNHPYLQYLRAIRRSNTFSSACNICMNIT